MNALATWYATLLEPGGILNPSDSTWMEPTPGEMVASTISYRFLIAAATMSKPGPQLAMEAGDLTTTLLHLMY